MSSYGLNHWQQSIEMPGGQSNTTNSVYNNGIANMSFRGQSFVPGSFALTNFQAREFNSPNFLPILQSGLYQAPMGSFVQSMPMPTMGNPFGHPYGTPQEPMAPPGMLPPYVAQPAPDLQALTGLRPLVPGMQPMPGYVPSFSQPTPYALSQSLPTMPFIGITAMQYDVEYTVKQPCSPFDPFGGLGQYGITPGNPAIHGNSNCQSHPLQKSRQMMLFTLILVLLAQKD